MLVMQDLGGTAKTVEAGIKLVAELLPRVNALRRETVPASEIILGTNCGGSDGNSGITANPALGVASDLTSPAAAPPFLARRPKSTGPNNSSRVAPKRRPLPIS